MIHLHEITHAALTGTGSRPRPAHAGASELAPVPVLIALYRPGETQPYAMVPVTAFALHPHRDGLPAELVLACVAPKDERLHAMLEEAMERIGKQSELLSKKAEKANANAS